jgi:hypothetical protein
MVTRYQDPFYGIMAPRMATVSGHSFAGFVAPSLGALGAGEGGFISATQAFVSAMWANVSSAAFWSRIWDTMRNITFGMFDLAIDFAKWVGNGLWDGLKWVGGKLQSGWEYLNENWFHRTEIVKKLDPTTGEVIGEKAVRVLDAKAIGYTIVGAVAAVALVQLARAGWRLPSVCKAVTGEFSGSNISNAGSCIGQVMGAVPALYEEAGGAAGDLPKAPPTKEEQTQAWVNEIQDAKDCDNAQAVYDRAKKDGADADQLSRLQVAVDKCKSDKNKNLALYAGLGLVAIIGVGALVSSARK